MSTPNTHPVVDVNADVLEPEAMAILARCDAETIIDRMRDGTLPGIKLGRGWVCTREAFLHALTRLALANTERKAPPAPVARAAAPAMPPPSAAGNGTRSRRKVPPVLPPFPGTNSAAGGR